MVDELDVAALQQKIERLTRELQMARNQITMRPHADQWHKLHEDNERLRAALEKIVWNADHSIGAPDDLADHARAALNPVK